jgi:hypothetical protein
MPVHLEVPVPDWLGTIADLPPEGGTVLEHVPICVGAAAGKGERDSRAPALDADLFSSCG